jgi:hypothetical protein
VRHWPEAGPFGGRPGDPLKRYHPTFEWHLYWIRKQDQFEALKQHAEVFLALHLLARATQGGMRGILPLLPGGFERILERPEGTRVSGEMVMYITQQGSDIRADELKSFLEGEMGTKQGGQVMSEFDRVMGLARAEGQLLARRQSLTDVIRSRFGFGAITPSIEKHLDGLDADGLRETLRRAATAEKLDDIFE